MFYFFQFSRPPRQVTMTASSSGSAIIQLEADYNIVEPENTNDLEIRVNTDVDTLGKVFVKTCVS